jgi:hypothetical protein
VYLLQPLNRRAPERTEAKEIRFEWLDEEYKAWISSKGALWRRIRQQIECN